MTIAYKYARKDGGHTFCYGELCEDSNFDIVCEDEEYDGIWPMRDPDIYPTWHAACRHLEEEYNNKIEELSAI